MATELPTPSETATIAQQKLRSLLDPGGTGAVNLSSGSRNDIMISVMGALINRVNTYVADRVSARTLSTATGDDLDALATDVFQDARKPAVAATGNLNLVRTGTAVTVIPNGTRFAVPATSSTPGIFYIATQDVSVPINQLTAYVPVVCTQTGLIGNATYATVTSIADSLVDTTWTIAPPPVPLPNPNTYLPMAGGAELETDDQLRARLQASAYDDSKKRGTKKAIQIGALQVPGVASNGVTVIEPGDGTVLVYVGDASYNLSAALQAAVLANLENWRAFGVPCIVKPYAVNTLNLVANIYMSKPLSNYNLQTILTQANTNLNNYFSNRPRPDEVYGGAIISALCAAHPEVQTAAIITFTNQNAAGVQPDSTFNIKHSTDALAGVASALPRYVINNTSLVLAILPPLTT